MKIASFRTGQHLILRFVEYKIFRIVRDEQVVLERQNDGALISFDKQSLMESLVTGELEILSDLQKQDHSNGVLNPLSCYSDELQAEASRRYEYLRSVIGVVGDVPTRIGIIQVIKEHAELIGDTSPPSVSTLFRWWKKWLQSGNDVAALVPITTKKRNSFVSGYLKDLFHEVAEEVLLRPVPGSIQDAYDLYIVRLQEYNKACSEPLRVPSRSTFYRQYQSSYDGYEKLRAQKGKRIADEFYRASGAGVTTSRILERVEIDHTPIDNIIVDDRTGLAIGKPNLTALIDHYSRMILGVYIGFEPPSELSVMLALKHSILPKPQYQEEFEFVHNEWKAYGIPSVLVCDNGSEFHGHQLKRLARELNIELFFCPPRKGSAKGTIERVVGYINDRTSKRLPGTTFSNINERADYDPVKKSSIPLRYFQSLVYEWIINIYQESFHSGINTSPRLKWTEGLESIEPVIPANIYQFDLAFTREYHRKLSHSGIKVCNLQYNSHELKLLSHRIGHKSSVRIRLDPENLGRIWIYDDQQEHFFVVPSVSEEAEGLTVRQQKLIRSMITAHRKELDTDTLRLAKVSLAKRLRDGLSSKKITERTRSKRIESDMDCFQSPVTPVNKPPKADSNNPLTPPAEEDLFEVDWGRKK